MFNRVYKPFLFIIKQNCKELTYLPFSKKHFLDSEFDQFKSIFQNYSFSSSQIYSINKFLKSKDDLITFNSLELEKTLKFWNSMIKVDPFLSIERKSNRNEKININSILTKNPELILINVDEMKERFDKLMNLGFLTGDRDLFRIFSLAPKGLLLQDWQDLVKKFYYIQYRIIEWLYEKNKDKYPKPHPIVHDPEVMEKSFEHIKARFMFTILTGYKSPGRIVYNEPNIVTLKSMLIYEVQDFLKFIAPGCTEEEYFVFENMIEDEEDEEDQIFAQISNLGGNVESLFQQKFQKSVSFEASLRRKKVKHKY